MTRHANSGAGHIKADAHNDDYLVEIKDANKSFKLDSKELRELFVRAVRQDRSAMLLIYFTDGDFVVECRLIPGGKQLLEGNDNDE